MEGWGEEFFEMESKVLTYRDAPFLLAACELCCSDFLKFLIGRTNKSFTRTSPISSCPKFGWAKSYERSFEKVTKTDYEMNEVESLLLSRYD